VLTLDEPRVGGLAERVRAQFGREFGADAAFRVCDHGDLRFAGALGWQGGQLDARVVRRWALGELEALLEKHPGSHPTPAPTLLILVLADAQEARARAHLLDVLGPLRAALESVGLPAGVQPRLAPLVAWPGNRDRSDAARRAAWLRDLAFLRDEVHAVDAVFLVARSNYHPSHRGELRYVSAAERDAVVAKQVALLASSAVLEEVLRLRRGRASGGWLALGTAALDAYTDAQALEQAAWPWVHASAGDWGGWSPTPVNWLTGGGADIGPVAPAGASPIPGVTASPMLVRCLHGIPSDYLDNYAAWAEAYRALPEAQRSSLHRFEEAAWREPSPVAPVEGAFAARSGEWVP
jgi:hypothetical protein